jgi:predicted RecB family endonuclease
VSWYVTINEEVVRLINVPNGVALEELNGANVELVRILRDANITTAEQLRDALSKALCCTCYADMLLATRERDALKLELAHEKQRAELHAARVKEFEGTIIDESAAKVRRETEERTGNGSPDTSDCLNSQLPSTLAKRNLPAPKKVVIRCEGDWEP